MVLPTPSAINSFLISAFMASLSSSVAGKSVCNCGWFLGMTKCFLELSWQQKKSVASEDEKFPRPFLTSILGLWARLKRGAERFFKCTNKTHAAPRRIILSKGGWVLFLPGKTYKNLNEVAMDVLLTAECICLCHVLASSPNKSSEHDCAVCILLPTRHDHWNKIHTTVDI